MKQFFKYVFATVVGIIISTILLMVFCIVLLIGIVATATKEKVVTVKPNSILHLAFSESITERTPNNPFKKFSSTTFIANRFNMFIDKSIGLNDILADIQKAKNDPNIKGIYLDAAQIPAGIATIEEIRNALLEFKKSGKFVIAYAEGYNQGAYYLASVSDKIYLNPEGALELKGLSAQLMFFKGTLDKLGITPQIYRHGKFKSAVESFDLEKMSASNRLQTLTYVDAIWNHILEGIAATRKVSVNQLNDLADQLKIQNAADALTYKLIDGLKYSDELYEELAIKSGNLTSSTSDASKLKSHFVEIDDYATVTAHTPDKSPDKIALIYATGTIEGGEGDDETIGSERISKAIRDARQDKSIKAIVLRINSPGGSALASDVIWRETKLACKEKPLVVSMGDVAASGGYYIACAANQIVAEPNTITGSIGVFGILPDMHKFLNEKLGITIDTVNSNKHADIGSPFRALTPYEGRYIQQSVEHVYSSFINKVAEGRKKSVAEIDSIGQGRVWSGVDAKRIGLVDELGGIHDAIALAAKDAKLATYNVVEFPKQKDIFEQLLKGLGDNSQTQILKSQLGVNYNYFKQLKTIETMQGVQARLPYDVVLY